MVVDFLHSPQGCCVFLQILVVEGKCLEFIIRDLKVLIDSLLNSLLNSFPQTGSNYFLRNSNRVRSGMDYFFVLLTFKPVLEWRL